MIQTDVSDSAMAAAIEANHIETFKSFGVVPNFRINDSPPKLWFETPGVALPLFNGVLRSNLTAANVDSEIDEVMRRFQAQRLPALWRIWPSSQPDNLAERLTARGWELAEEMPGMAADLQQLSAETRAIENFRIVRVTDENQLQQWLQPLALGFEMPEALASLFYDLIVHIGFNEDAIWQNYLGLLDGQPVACSSLVPEAGVAGIYAVAAVPEVRGMGIGTAITHHALVQAKAKGYRVAILGSSEMGYNIYRNLGFKEYFKVGQYLYNPTD